MGCGASTHEPPEKGASPVQRPNGQSTTADSHATSTAISKVEQENGNICKEVDETPGGRTVTDPSAPAPPQASPTGCCSPIPSSMVSPRPSGSMSEDDEYLKHHHAQHHVAFNSEVAVKHITPANTERESSADADADDAAAGGPLLEGKLTMASLKVGRVVDYYEQIEQIGSGSYGLVWRVRALGGAAGGSEGQRSPTGVDLAVRCLCA